MRALLILLAGLYVTLPVFGQAEPPPATPTQSMPVAPPVVPKASKPATDIKQTVGAINFQGTPLPAVLEYYARLTKRSIIQAPNLAGVVYFQSQTDLTVDEAIQALDSVLAINGIAVVPMGDKFLKVVQIATAKQEGVNVEVNDEKTLPAADTLMTQIIPLKYADPAEVVPTLQPFLHAYGQLLPLAKSNSILITDTGGNINQMMEIVKYVDQPSALKMETKVYELKNSKASEVVQRLQQIIQESQQLGGSAAAPGAPRPPTVPGRLISVRPTTPGATATGSMEESIVEGKVILTPDDRTNKMFVLSRASNFAFFDMLVEELDAKMEPDVVTKVIELQYANAEDAAGLLNSLITGGSYTARRTTTPGGTSAVRPPTLTLPPPTSAGAGSTTGAGLAGLLEFAEGVRILPDPRTNSLLIMATKADLARLEKLIGSVDMPVAQVLVEVVIAEVKLDNGMEVGVNLVKRAFEKGQVTMYGGTVTKTDSSGNPVPNPLDLTQAEIGGIPAGAALSSALTYFATFQKLDLDAAVTALSRTSRFKVLSTPIIQTLHNQEANIVVGESRPVVTGTLSDVYGTSTSTNLNSTALRSNVEYKDIAIELKVTPRINPDGYVTLDVDQKVNDLGGEVDIGGAKSPIITKREAKSLVTVKDQSTIVLGGLIREDKTTTETKVPFLGDIPVFGLLFRNKSVGKTRTELIVFIRPTVLRTDEAAVAEAKRRSQLLKVGAELELENQFRAQTPTNAVPEKAAPPSEQPKESADMDRHAAKVKALTEQTQPTD